MSLTKLDSRTGFGTDIEFSNYPHLSESMGISRLYPSKQKVRIILGRLGGIVRLSALDLGIVAEGANYEEAWTQFLKKTQGLDDDVSAWLTFDIGKPRPEEISEALDAPEDEEWLYLDESYEV